MTLTTDEAAELVGVRPATIRQWVKRGHLAPSTPGRFDADAVTECARGRWPATRVAQHRAAVARWSTSQLDK